jgi:PIN domain nuclease of toxin-antitoxin system
MILLDTHVLLWVRQGSARVGRRALRRIEGALRQGELLVSAFSFWELAMLVSAERLGLRVTVDEFRATTLRAGVVEVPLDGAVAILSTSLGLHGDPADRIIVATALAQGAVLATADEKILSMRGGPSMLDVRS